MGEVLKGKVAIVTGAGRGVGWGIAVEFAKEGAKVVVASRSQGPIDETVREIEAAGGTAIGLSCDVGDKVAIADLIARTVDTFGGIDILVNNAQSFGGGSSPTAAPMLCPLEDFSDEEWDHTFLTGPKATFWMMQAAFPYLKASGAGRIINFGSSMGQLGFPGVVAYVAAKEAIRGMSRTAANEWGVHGITVNVINPVIITDTFKAYGEADPASLQKALDAIPMKRVGEIKDAGRVGVFIAGPDASYLTGMTFQVDGGHYIHP